MANKRAKKTRPKLLPVSDEMRHASELLAREVSEWTDVSTRLMFGLRAVYRRGVIFAMLPGKRSLEIPDAVAYKDAGEWKVVEVGDEHGVGRALAVLEKAYKAADLKVGRLSTGRRFFDSRGSLY